MSDQTVYLVTREDHPARIFATIEGATAYVVGSAKLVTLELLRDGLPGTQLTPETARREIERSGSIFVVPRMSRFAILATAVGP
jgi:hypothetical protein